MIFSISVIMKSTPILVCRDPDYADDMQIAGQVQTLANIPFIVVNPSIIEPRVKGVLYAYSLFPMANDVIVPLSNVTKAKGLSSTLDLSSSSFEVLASIDDLKKAVLSFYRRSSGAIDFTVSDRVNAIGTNGLQSFLNFITSPAQSIDEVISSNADDVSAKFYKLFKGETNDH